MNVGLKIALTPVAFILSCWIGTMGDVNKAVFVRAVIVAMVFGGLAWWIWSF